MDRQHGRLPQRSAAAFLFIDVGPLPLAILAKQYPFPVGLKPGFLWLQYSFAGNGGCLRLVGGLAVLVCRKGASKNHKSMCTVFSHQRHLLSWALPGLSVDGSAMGEFFSILIVDTMACGCRW